MTPANEIRVLAIDPTTKGFGFVVIEGPDQLVDWGVRTVSGNKQTGCLRKVRELIELYQPAVVVLEDISRGSRRCRRVRQLIERIRSVAIKGGSKPRLVAHVQVREALAPAPTKHDIAVAIARRFPELVHCVPPVRKPWMPEHHSAAIFDAAAFALTYFHESKHHPRH